MGLGKASPPGCNAHLHRCLEPRHLPGRADPAWPSAWRVTRNARVYPSPPPQRAPTMDRW
ncbi:hypothetical protein C4K40_1617 [Pseudomonas sp. CMR5c]|nr:hypothetical protein C4K40_1617 [Pseudomonas sp. CMR5c]